MSLPRAASALSTRPLWWGFVPYGAISLVHVAGLALGMEAVYLPTKLMLMPALAVAVLWGGRRAGWGPPLTLLFAAIALSWLGDGAATFFPFLDDELPAMLLCFGLAHVCYMWLFARFVSVRRRPPRWAIVYLLWWAILVLLLWPRLGGLAVAVAVYGVVLGGTALLSTLGRPIVAWGGAFFLASDTVLAFRLFTPELMPPWTSPLVMATYTLGQGLIAAGVLVTLRDRRLAG